MATAAQSYHNALLALSGNAQLKDARSNLLTNISHTELEQVAKHAMAHPFSRSDSETILSTVLDIIANEKSKSDETPIKIEDDGEKIGNEEGKELTPEPNRGESRSKRKSVIEVQWPRMARRKRVPHQTLQPSQANSFVEANFETLAFTRGRRRTNRPAAVEAPLRNADTVSPSQATTQEKNVRNEKSENADPLPPMMFFVLNVFDNTSGSWKNGKEVPAGLLNTIRSHFKTHYTSTEQHKDDFSKMFNIRHGCRYPGCVRNTVLHSALNTYEKSDGNVFRTCDACIGDRRWCVKVRKRGGSLQLEVYPLPDSLRLGKLWTEMEYWIKA